MCVLCLNKLRKQFTRTKHKTSYVSQICSNSNEDEGDFFIGGSSYDVLSECSLTSGIVLVSRTPSISFSPSMTVDSGATDIICNDIQLLIKDNFISINIPYSLRARQWFG
jgi:hypothetical protein